MGYQTLNLSTCVESSIDTKTDRNRQKGKKKKLERIPCVRYHVSHVTCHAAIDPPPANSPIMNSRLVRKALKTLNKEAKNH